MASLHFTSVHENCYDSFDKQSVDLKKIVIKDSTHVYPAERDEVVLVLHLEQLLLVLRVARVGSSALLREDEVRHAKRVLRLQRNTPRSS